MGTRLNDHLTKAQIDSLKDRLLAEVERLENKFSVKKVEFQEAETNGKDEVDSANDNILLSQDMRFSNRDMLYLKKIKKTLEKIDTEQFGMCEDCDAPITFQRLEARPITDQCIHCKEESERAEHQNFTQRKSKSLGKEMHISSTAQ